MIRILLTISLTSFWVIGNSQELSGSVYDIGPSKMDCKIYGECDCCTSSLLFLDKLNFALMDYCTFDYTLTSGTYKIESNTVTLKFKPVAITSGQDATEENSNPYLEKKEVEINPIIFSLGKCENGELMFENKQFNSYRFGLRDRQGELSTIQDLLKSKEWSLLNE